MSRKPSQKCERSFKELTENIILKVLLHNISKAFPPDNVVFKSFSATFSSGSITFITGHNGCGKSVLAKILAGEQRVKPDSGIIQLGEEQYPFLKYNTTVARENGVVLVPQHLPHPRGVTALEFLTTFLPKIPVIFPGRQFKKHLLYIADQLRLELDVDFSVKLQQCSLSFIQKLYLLGATLTGAQLLILDEPTAHLNTDEVAALSRAIEYLTKAKGCTLIIMGHPTQLQIAKGNSFVLSDSRLTLGNLSSSIVSPPKVQPGNVLCSLGGVSSQKAILKESEIISVRAKTMTELSTLSRQILESPSTCLSSDKLIDVALVPFNAIEHGLANNLNVLENCLINRWSEVSNYGIVWSDAAGRFSNHIVSKLHVKPSDLNGVVDHLSGGNKQRLIIGRTYLSRFNAECGINRPTTGRYRLLVGCNLFRGLDDNGVRDVSNFLGEEIAQGATVLLLNISPNRNPNSIEWQCSHRHFYFNENRSFIEEC